MSKGRATKEVRFCVNPLDKVGPFWSAWFDWEGDEKQAIEMMKEMGTLASLAFQDGHEEGVIRSFPKGVLQDSILSMEIREKSGNDEPY